MAVAVKFTVVPGQIVVADDAMVTDGVTNAFTVMVITLLVAVAGLGQIELEVTTTETLSVFANVVDVKVALFDPTFTPLTFH